MLALVSEYISQAERDTDVRVIILTGNGRAFCAGLDVVGAQSRTGSQSGENAKRAIPVTLDVKTFPPGVIFNCEKPVICAMNGAAAGFGMDMALAMTRSKAALAMTILVQVLVTTKSMAAMVTISSTRVMAPQPKALILSMAALVTIRSWLTTAMRSKVVKALIHLRSI